jgi:hypothetical protein
MSSREEEACAADHLATVAALAVLAICATACAHEAVGHGDACLLPAERIGGIVFVLFAPTMGRGLY